jgi:hypothetical protein
VDGDWALHTSNGRIRINAIRKLRIEQSSPFLGKGFIWQDASSIKQETLRKENCTPTHGSAAYELTGIARKRTLDWLLGRASRARPPQPEAAGKRVFKRGWLEEILVEQFSSCAKAKLQRLSGFLSIEKRGCGYPARLAEGYWLCSSASNF